MRLFHAGHGRRNNASPKRFKTLGRPPPPSKAISDVSFITYNMYRTYTSRRYYAFGLLHDGFAHRSSKNLNRAPNIYRKRTPVAARGAFS